MPKIQLSLIIIIMEKKTKTTSTKKSTTKKQKKIFTIDITNITSPTEACYAVAMAKYNANVALTKFDVDSIIEYEYEKMVSLITALLNFFNETITNYYEPKRKPSLFKRMLRKVFRKK